MTQEDGIKIVHDIIRNAWRHKNYKRTVDLAQEYKTFITGEGIEEYLKHFNIREDNKDFNLRKEVTVNITEAATANLIDPQYKLPRSNSIDREFVYTDADVEKHRAMTLIKSHFWEGSRSVEDYMGSAWIELNNLDPNTFVVIDWKTNENGQRIKPYPVEYPAEQVYHFNKKSGVLQWVLLHRDAEGADPEMYLLYTKEFTIIFTRVEDVEWKNHDADVMFYKEFPVTKYEGVDGVIKIGDEKNTSTYYNINILKPHNLGFVPGLFVGFVSDLTNRTTYLSPISKAFPYLKKVVKLNSEFDITTSKHAFPQKVQYANPCPDCNNGKTREGTVCGACGGSGTDPRDTHETGLDVMKIPRPRDAQDLMDLSKLIHYVPADVRIPRFQFETLENLLKKSKEAVYNSVVYSTKEFTETAYSKNVDLQHVYDALWPMAKAFERAYNFIIECLAKITDLDENLVHQLKFRKDFKMKSPTDLYNDLVLVTQSKASEFVKQNIEDDLAEVIYEGYPRELLKYKTQKHFYPFNGKSGDEIQMIVTSPNMCSPEVKILWANFSFLFDEIELEFAKKKIDFYMLPMG